MEVSLQEEIEALKLERNRAIERCDFARSKELDAHIKALTDQDKENNSETLRIKQKLEFNIRREVLLTEKSEIETATQDEISKITEVYQKRILSIREEQAQVKQALNEKQARELESASSRIIPEAEDKRKAAKFQARSGNYDEAEKLMEECNELTKSTLEKRIQEINLKYAVAAEKVDEEYANKIILCKKKLSRDIHFAQDKCNAELARIERELNTAQIRATKPPKKTTKISRVYKESNKAIKGSSPMTTPTKTPSRTSSRLSKTPNRTSKSSIKA